MSLQIFMWFCLGLKKKRIIQMETEIKWVVYTRLFCTQNTHTQTYINLYYVKHVHLYSYYSESTRNIF